MKKIFELNEQSKKTCIYVLVINIILIIVCQILGWVVYKSYDIYTYKYCTYNLSGSTYCSIDSSDQLQNQGDTYYDYGCPGPTTKDCSTAQIIRNLYLAGLIMPICWYGTVTIITLYLILCIVNRHICLKLLLSSFILCDFLCIVFYICDATMMNNNQNYQILFSQQTLGVCISLGIFYIFQTGCKCYLNLIICQYLTVQQKQAMTENAGNVVTQPPAFVQQPKIQQILNPQPIPRIDNQVDAVLQQAIIQSKYEQIQKEREQTLLRQQEQKILQEQQEQIRLQQQLDQEEINLVEKIRIQQEEEEIKKAILLSMQENKKTSNNYLPD